MTTSIDVTMVPDTVLIPPLTDDTEEEIARLNFHNTQSPEHALQVGICYESLRFWLAKTNQLQRYAVYPDVEINSHPQHPEVKIAPDILIIPDVTHAAIRKSRSYSIKKYRQIPCLVIEVGATLPNERDYKTKVEKYMQLGIPEYLIFDIAQPRITQYLLQSDGTYARIADNEKTCQIYQLDLLVQFAGPLVRFFDHGELIPISEETAVELGNLTQKLEAAHKQIAGHTLSLQAKDQALQAKDQALQENAQTIQAKDQALQAKDQALQAKDQALQENAQALQAKDQEIENLRKLLKSQDGKNI